MAATAKYLFFGFIAAAVTFEIVADVFLKKWAHAQNNTLLIVGLALYFVGTIFWAFSLKYEFLSKAISVFTILNLVIVALVGVLVFKEDLSLVNKIGIALGVVSIVLVEI